MRLLHLADLHLGKSLGDFDLYEDQKFILEQILGIIREKSVDAVLISGDVYDRANPGDAATSLLDSFLTGLVQQGVRTFIISGNHDSEERLNYGSSLFQANNIFIASKFDGTLHKYSVQDEFGTVDFYLMPFIKASQVRHFYPDEEIRSYEDAVRLVVEKAEVNPENRSVMLAHQFVVAGGADPLLGGSEGPGTKTVGTVEKIGNSSFDVFEYVALGHIHAPQKMGRETVRYAGSPIKYSLSEVNNKKSVPLVTLEEKGKAPEIELIPLTPLRDLRHIRGELKTLLDDRNIVDSNDFIFATLTDEDVVNDAMGIFQSKYPNTVKIEYDNSHTREIEQVDIAAMTENRSFEDIVRDFYGQVYGTEMSEEELEVMKKAAREAGVLNETD